jgi:hypothetical protein
MSDEYEYYQGLVLRSLIVESQSSLMIRPFVKEGRINAFVVNGKVGIFVKHSAKRLSPWRFSFNLDQAADLLDLESRYFDTFAVFVCGDDGIVSLDVGGLHQIVSFQDSEHAWVRIDRKPRSQYAVSGNRSDMPNKIANGITQIHDKLLERLRERQVS